MTTEQAIKLLHRLQDEQFDGIHGDERREALEMAIRALEGDGDTIYRQAAIDEIMSLIEEPDDDFNEGVRTSASVIYNLPSAHPQCRTGRWIRKTDTRFGEMLNDILICSECGIAFSTLNMIRRSYCPNCGARMDGESDERSD